MINTRSIRLAGWVAAILTALGGQLIWHHSRSAVACLIIFISLLAIFALLCTAPGNAIRLSRWISELVIAFTTIALSIAESRTTAIARLLSTILTIAILRFMKKSAWWAVLVAWMPA